MTEGKVAGAKKKEKRPINDPKKFSNPWESRFWNDFLSENNRLQNEAKTGKSLYAGLSSDRVEGIILDLARRLGTNATVAEHILFGNHGDKFQVELVEEAQPEQESEEQPPANAKKHHPAKYKLSYKDGEHLGIVLATFEVTDPNPFRENQWKGRLLEGDYAGNDYGMPLLKESLQSFVGSSTNSIFSFLWSFIFGASSYRVGSGATDQGFSGGLKFLSVFGPLDRFVELWTDQKIDPEEDRGFIKRVWRPFKRLTWKKVEKGDQHGTANSLEKQLRRGVAGKIFYWLDAYTGKTDRNSRDNNGLTRFLANFAKGLMYPLALPVNMITGVLVGVVYPALMTAGVALLTTLKLTLFGIDSVTIFTRTDDLGQTQSRGGLVSMALRATMALFLLPAAFLLFCLGVPYRLFKRNIMPFVRPFLQLALMVLTGVVYRAVLLAKVVLGVLFWPILSLFKGNEGLSQYIKRTGREFLSSLAFWKKISAKEETMVGNRFDDMGSQTGQLANMGKEITGGISKWLRPSSLIESLKTQFKYIKSNYFTRHDKLASSWGYVIFKLLLLVGLLAAVTFLSGGVGAVLLPIFAKIGAALGPVAWPVNVALPWIIHGFVFGPLKFLGWLKLDFILQPFYHLGGLLLSALGIHSFSAACVFGLVSMVVHAGMCAVRTAVDRFRHWWKGPEPRIEGTKVEVVEVDPQGLPMVNDGANDGLVSGLNDAGLQRRGGVPPVPPDAERQAELNKNADEDEHKPDADSRTRSKSAP